MTALKEKPEFREGNQPLFDYLDQTYVESEMKRAGFRMGQAERGGGSLSFLVLPQCESGGLGTDSAGSEKPADE